jgi:hypothetical protein
LSRCDRCQWRAHKISIFSKIKLNSFNKQFFLLSFKVWASSDDILLKSFLKLNEKKNHSFVFIDSALRANSCNKNMSL